MKCNRTACANPLYRQVYLIWNQPSTGIPRMYCFICGKRIIAGNEHDDLKLKYEITTVEDAVQRYPSLVS